MIGASAPGSSGGRAATSAAVRIGLATTGPVPGTISTSIPASFSGTTMSLNRIAASTRVPADRLQGDLGRQVRRQTGLEHPGAAANLAVLRQRAAGLPHEPHRPVIGPAPAVGGDQRGACGAAVP